MAEYDPAESHDLNFKTIIVENPWDAITFAMPKCINFFQHEPEIEPIREETIKTFFSDSFARMDVPLLAKYEKVAFTFLIEHQHDPYSFSIHQLARYVSHLEEQYERDVVPIVYFPYGSAKSKHIKRSTKSTFMGRRYHYFTYQAVFLKDHEAQRHLASTNVIARLLLPFMQYSRNDWLEVLDGAIKGVLKLVDPTQGLRRSKYLDFVLHYFNLGQREWEIYGDYKAKQEEREVFDMVSTILKKQGRQEGWIAGRQEGRQEGWQEGRQEGKIEQGRDLLLMLLPKRFGAMPLEIERRIREFSDLDRIQTLLSRLLEIHEWQEVEQFLKPANDNLQ